MNANRYFSFSRLGLVMKRDFMENWKTNFYRFLGPYTAILIVMILGYLKGGSFSEFSEMVFTVFAAVLFIGSAISASRIMEVMNAQQNRISLLMLPATSLEKFVTRALYVTVGFVLILILALLLAEVTRFLFIPLFSLPDTFQQSVLPFVWNEITDIKTLTFTGEGAAESYQIAYLTKVLGWLFFSWGHSFFILGGCYWYKNAFWKTLGLIILVNFFFIFVSVNLVESLDESVMEEILLWCEANFSWVTITGILSFAIVMFMLLILLNWWLSYRCFTCSQVIKPKFRLL